MKTVLLVSNFVIRINLHWVEKWNCNKMEKKFIKWKLLKYAGYIIDLCIYARKTFTEHDLL